MTDQLHMFRKMVLVMMMVIALMMMIPIIVTLIMKTAEKPLLETELVPIHELKHFISDN